MKEKVKRGSRGKLMGELEREWSTLHIITKRGCGFLYFSHLRITEKNLIMGKTWRIVFT